MTPAKPTGDASLAVVSFFVVDVLFLCTGNATRSVLAAELLRLARPDLEVDSAGTLAIEGHPMSWRTRAAFEALGLEPPNRHRSRQATELDLARSQMVIGLAPEHVRWVRREHLAYAPKSLTLRRYVSGIPSEHAAPLEDWEDVVDPGGGEVDAFIACAHEIDHLIRQAATRFEPGKATVHDR